MYLLLLASLLGAMYQIFVSYKYAQSDALSFAILRAARALVFTLVLSVAFIYNSNVILGRIAADIISCAALLIAFFIVFGNPFIKHKYRLPIIKDVIPYAAPFVVALIASFTLNYVDRFFVAHYLDLASVANYALSQRAVGIVTLVASGIALVIPPLFYKNIESEPEKVYSGIREVMSICFWLCIIASSLLPIALWLVYGEKYSGALGQIPLLLVGVYFSVAVSSSTALCLLIDKRSALNMVTGIAAAIMSAGINVLLLPRIGIYGAIFAYVFSMSGLYVLQYFLARKRFPKIPALILQPLLLLAVCGTFSYFIESDNSLSSEAIFVLTTVGISATIFMGIGIKNAKAIHA
jgi:O-antigen/teichoic acid export membrane protein